MISLRRVPIGGCTWPRQTKLFCRSAADGCKGPGTLPSAPGAPGGIPPGAGGGAVPPGVLPGVNGWPPGPDSGGTVSPGATPVVAGGTPGPVGGWIVPGCLRPAVPGVVPVVPELDPAVPDVDPGTLGGDPGVPAGGTPTGVFPVFMGGLTGRLIGGLTGGLTGGLLGGVGNPGGLPSGKSGYLTRSGYWMSPPGGGAHSWTTVPPGAVGGTPVFDPGWFPDDVPGGGKSGGRVGGLGPGGTPVVPPGWPACWILLVPGWLENGGVGSPGTFVPVDVAWGGPWLTALLLTASSVMALSNGGARIPDVLFTGVPEVPPADVVFVPSSARRKRYPPKALVS